MEQRLTRGSHNPKILGSIPSFATIKGHVADNFKDELIGGHSSRLRSAKSAMTERLWRSCFLVDYQLGGGMVDASLLISLLCILLPTVAAFVVFAAMVARRDGK